MKKTGKIWLGVGAFILTSSSMATAAEPLHLDRSVEARPDEVAANPLSGTPQVRIDLNNVWAQGGEGGAGGEGGEGGINLETVGSDPVEYAIALQVIAAHYDAGIAAYAGGEQEAGAQMFAHGLSEIYSVMEDLFKKFGVTTLGAKLETAVAAAVDKKPVKDVRSRVNDVLEALQQAKERGPQPFSTERMNAYLVGELIERAAAQYSISRNDPTLEPYLDGLGFVIAARREAKPVLAWLRQSDKQSASALSKALELVERAYPGVRRPAKPAVSESQLLVAASRARLAVSAYR